MSAYLLHLAVKSIIPRPQYQPHSTLLGIPYQHRQIYLFHHLEQIRFHVHSPSFVQYHIFNPVLRGKINIVLIRLVVNSRLEIHTLQVPVVPPVPRHLAGFNPTQVSHLSGLPKQITHIIHRQCRAILCHHGYTPRQRRFTFPPSLRLWIQFCYIFLALFHNHLEVVVASLLHSLRITGMLPFQTSCITHAL